MAHIRQTLADQRTAALAAAVDQAYDDIDITLEDLDRADVIASRTAAAQDSRIILDALETGMTERDARRLYSNHLVDRALNAQRLATSTAQPAF